MRRVLESLRVSLESSQFYTCCWRSGLYLPRDLRGPVFVRDFSTFWSRKPSTPPKNPTPREDLTFMRLGVRTSDRRCVGVTRASANLWLQWVDCGRKEHCKNLFFASNFALDRKLKALGKIPLHAFKGAYERAPMWWCNAF